MAYFSNGSEGMCFDKQCSRCKYGQMPCPIALVQHEYNYDACNNETARKILDTLVKDNGDCAMFKMAKSDFEFKKEEVKQDDTILHKVEERYGECQLVSFVHSYGIDLQIMSSKVGVLFTTNDIQFVILSTLEEERHGSFLSYELYHFESGVRCTSDISLEAVFQKLENQLSRDIDKFLKSVEKAKQDLIKNKINYPVNKL